LAIALISPVAFAQMPTDPAVLWEQATIYRDEWGVPHVQADNFLAMGFAFGYAQANDHAEAMLKAYRIANGRAAEIYGEDFAASDEFSLKMGHADLALAAFPYVDAITRDLCTGFALGVNAWLIENPTRAPEWADGVRAEDVLALMHAYLMSFAPFDLPGTYARPAAANTGNAWAIAPQRSTTGETILVMNPHADYLGPFQWYEAHLTCGAFNVYGATLFGLPVILQGHNGALAWALTPNLTDFADVYMEPDQTVRKKNPNDPTMRSTGPVDLDTLKYLQMVANAKTYYVRTPAGMVERQVPYMETPRGPVMGKYNNKLCSWMIGGYRDFGALQQLHLMGSAANLAQFQQALQLRQLPSFHVLYADREGNIAYVYNTKGGTKLTPPSPQDQVAANRAQGSNSPLNIISWNAPVPGGDHRFAWGSIIPSEQLPVELNPASGYLQACGNPPWLATENSTMDTSIYPPWFSLDPDTFRAKRARRLLATDKRSFQDAQAMLFDVLVPGAMYAMPKLIDAAERKSELLANAHPDLAPCLDILRNWNYVAEPDSEGMTVFHVWWTAMRGLMPRDMNDFEIWTAVGENSDEMQLIALQAAEEAARVMRSEFQTLNKPWGEAHVFVRGENKLPAPGSVSGQPMFVASDYLFLDGQWQVTYGYGFAMAVSFGAQTVANSLVPFGASENPSSQHFSDQAKLIAERRLKATRFDPVDVRRYANSAHGSVVHVSPRGMDAHITIRTQSPVTISSKVDTKPPAAVPQGLATFTVFAQLDQAPVEKPSLIELNVRVPEEVCADAHLDKLALYAYDATQGWAPLQSQQLNPQTRVIAARDRVPRVYAVLGPAAHRITPNPFARQRIAAAVPDAKPLIAQAEAMLPPKEPATTAPPRPVDMVAGPGVAAAMNESAVANARAKAAAQDSAPSPLTDTNEGDAPNVDAPAPDTLDEPAEPKADRTMPVMQAGLPTAPVVQPAKKEGALAWGTKMQLRPPGVEGLVMVSAEKQVGARLVVTPEPDAPLPPGMSAYTQFVKVEVQGDSTPVTLTVHLRPAVDAVPQGRLAELKLFALGSDGNWSPVAGQSFDEGKRDFKATDSTPRTYALLGPAQLAQQQTAAR